MKRLPLLIAALVATSTFADAKNLLQIADPAFESLPASGMAIYKSPEAQNALDIKVVREGALEGAACLRISLPVAAYASVSFPLDRSSETGSLEIAYKGELGSGSDVKIGLQSYTMDPGFNSVDFKPLLDGSTITSEWRVHKQSIERAKEATHWQLSIGIKGPATIWIDGLKAEGL